jgi:hypothetical protein
MLIKNIKNYEQIKTIMYKKKLANRISFWNTNLIKKLVYLLYINNLIPSIIKKKINYEIKEIDKNVNYFSDERIAIYTVIFGNYDEVIEPECTPDNCDFFIVTDQTLSVNSKWKIISIDLEKYDLLSKKNSERNRFFKMHPHLLFSEYKFSMYIDGNISVITDPTEFIHDINLYGLSLHNHFRRKCVFNEIQLCIDSNKDAIVNLERHKEYLLSDEMPKNYGMLEASIIIREHNNVSCIKLMSEWWTEYSNFSKRDQISLPHILWKNNIEISEVSNLGNDIYSNYSFKKRKHIKLK